MRPAIKGKQEQEIENIREEIKNLRNCLDSHLAFLKELKEFEDINEDNLIKMAREKATMELQKCSEKSKLQFYIKCSK